MNRLCHFYMNGNCKFESKKCRHIHDSNFCKDYFWGKCNRGDKCKYNHFVTLYGIKNTLDYKPRKKSPDMRVLINELPTSESDVIIVNDILTWEEAEEYFNRIMENVKNQEIWKSWHGDNHLIANDHQDWKKDCPAFQELITRIEDYFGLTTRATRLNWFQSGEEFKPYHHDAAAVKPDKARNQNITIGLNLGESRIISFEHAKQGTIIDFPLKNGTLYAFMRDINVVWRHGVPQKQEKEDLRFNNERLSIVDWGYKEI